MSATAGAFSSATHPPSVSHHRFLDIIAPRQERNFTTEITEDTERTGKESAPRMGVDLRASRESGRSDRPDYDYEPNDGTRTPCFCVFSVLSVSSVVKFRSQTPGAQRPTLNAQRPTPNAHPSQESPGP